MNSSKASFPRADNTPMTPPNAAHAIALPSPRAANQMNTLSVTLFDWTVMRPVKNKLRIAGQLGSQSLLTTDLEAREGSPSPIDQTFFFPWDTRYTHLKLFVYEAERLQKEDQLAHYNLPLSGAPMGAGVIRSRINLQDSHKNVWGEVFIHLEFLACREKLRATKVKADLAQVCRRNDGASPVQRMRSPFDNAPAKDEVFDAAYPYNGVRVYCYVGAGWKKFKNKSVNVIVGVGGVGLKCTEAFPITSGGDFKVARVFEFPFQRERRIKIIVQESGSSQTLAAGIFDTLDLVNGNVLTCKQRLALYDPDIPAKPQGFMEVLTTFSSNRLEKSVRKMNEEVMAALAGNASPTNTPPSGSPVDAKEGNLAALSGHVEAQVATGNTRDTLKITPVNDMKTLLISVLAVTDLPSANDICTVQVCLGWYRSATGNYHSVKSDLRAGIFELHRIPYAKQRYVKIILKVANPQGDVREATAWLDLSMLSSVANLKTQLLMGSGSNFLGRIHLKMEFIPEALDASTPIKMDKEDVMQKTSLSAIVRQQQSRTKAGHSRSKSPPFVRSFGNMCVSSPLISPRARDGAGKSDAVLGTFLDESVTPASAEPHPSLDCEEILFELVGFRNLPDLDGLRLLKLQLVLRVGSRVSFTTSVLDTSDTDPNFHSLLFRIPMAELRFLTIDVFERTMTYKPFYLGRVVIDTAAVRPGDAVATYEQLSGLSGSTYCLYALENITDAENGGKHASRAMLVRNAKEENLPLTKYMRAAGGVEEQPSTTDSDHSSSDHVLANSTFCIKLLSLQDMISPFPFNCIDVYVQVEYGRFSVTSAPISIDVNRRTTINQLVKIPKTTNPWGMLRFRLLTGCPVRHPEKQLECDIPISAANLRETVVQFDGSNTKLFVTLSEVQEPCRIGGCEAILSTQSDSYFPSLVSA